MKTTCLVRNVVFILLILIVSSCSHPEKKSTNHFTKVYRTDSPYLIVLSMDAFRWDYPALYATPNLDSLANVGVKAESLMPCFPSKTFPNHYSIATGLYPENHGIVMNTFTDPVLGDYRLADRKAVQNPAFYLGEPIWVTSERQSIRSASFYWPGSEAAIHGIRPSIWKKYDESISFAARIDSVVNWLRRPADQRPHLIMLYLEQPDKVGHDFGPRHENTRLMVEKLDSLVGVFCKGINQLEMADSINLIITSDHGMQEISAQQSIALDPLVKEEWISNIKGANPVFMLQPKTDYSDSVFQALNAVDHMKVYNKANMPESFHYTHSDRILDVVCVADSAWSLYWKINTYSGGGAHGYDPANKNMHAIFYASGPAFKKKHLEPTFQNIQLYSLFTNVLRLVPAEIDGNLDNLSNILVEDF